MPVYSNATVRRSVDLSGAGSPGVEILTRSHFFLLQAVDLLLRTRVRRYGSDIEVHFAGVISDTDRELAAGSPVTITHGYVSHAESIALMRAAGALLFLPMQDLQDGRPSPQRFQGKPTSISRRGARSWGRVPPGDARDILDAAGNARLCRPDDVTGMAAAISEAVDDHRTGRPARPPDPGVVGRYEYRKLAEELAAVFDGVVESAG